MQKLTLLAASLLLSSTLAAAVPYDHIHLAATDAREAVDWYVKHECN